MIVIDENLLAEFREKTRCEWCGKRSWSGLDPAHIYARGLGSGSRLDLRQNLVSLCRLCHSNSHAGHEPTRAQLLEIAARREKTTAEKITEKVWRLRRDDRCKVWKVS